MKTKKEFKETVIDRFTRPVGYLYIFSILGIFSTPFIWIWHSWDLAWKIGLTSFVAAIIFMFIWYALKHIVSISVDQVLNKKN